MDWHSYTPKSTDEKPVDFGQLLRMEPDSDTTNVRNVSSAHWKRRSGRRAAAWVDKL